MTEPTIASPSTSLVLPEPTGPPVEVTVVNMTVLSYIGGKDAGTLLIQHNKLWWEELDQSEHAVKTIVNCHELGVNTREPSNLCEAGIDLGSQPTLVSADVSEEWAFMLDIQEFPTDENQYLSRLHVHGGDGRIAVLKLTFSSGGMSYCPSQQSLETTSTPSSNLETFEVPVTALIDGNSDQLLVFSNNWIRWFHVKGGKPLAAIINCRVWEPYWGGTKGLWCQECTHPSGETDLCEMNVDTWTNSTLQEVRLVKPVGRDFSFSWKQAPYGVANDEWTIRGGPSNGEWSLRLVNNGYSLVWCSLLLTFNKVGESSCESRPAQSCVELFDTNLVCHQSAQHCAFLAGDAAWPGENCNSYCEVRGEICQEAYSTHYSSCETNIASSCDLLADDNVCKCTRPAA